MRPEADVRSAGWTGRLALFPRPPRWPGKPPALARGRGLSSPRWRWGLAGPCPRAGARGLPGRVPALALGACRTTLVAGVILAVLALAPAAHAQGPPLLVRGELKASDPLDRVQKPSHARLHALELQAGQAILAELRSIDFDPWLRVEDAQ